MKYLDLKALAKINLGIDVLGIRPDGYHLLKMVMQTVSLYDEIQIRVVDKKGIKLKTNLESLPRDSRNIAYQAAALLLEEFQVEAGVEIEIKKNIPVAAGLAGGSTNAAAVLHGINQLFDLSLDEKALMERGLTIGADVPYCLMGGTALAMGIGEKLTPLPAMPKCSILLAKPPINVSTKKVYQELDKIEITHHPNIDKIIKGLEEDSLKTVANAMGNVLELVTIPLHPEIGQLKKVMMDAGALGALMSGSGATVFACFETKDKAELAKEKVEKQKLAEETYVVTPLSN